jgi:hypothetical protein
LPGDGKNRTAEEKMHEGKQIVLIDLITFVSTIILLLFDPFSHFKIAFFPINVLKKPEDILLPAFLFWL